MAKGNPQIAPLIALGQLLTEHPELPRIDWSVNAHGFFTAHHSSDEDVRPVVEAYAAVLGGEPEHHEYSLDGRPRQCFTLRTVWRDVEFDLLVAGPLPVAVAA